MSFRRQRGIYGIEHDGQTSSPLRKLWLPAILVLAIGVPLLALRSCAGRSSAKAAAEEEEAPGQTRYSMPEVEAQRERPWFWGHFLNFGQREKAVDAAKEDSATTATAAERWLDAERKAVPTAAAQSAEVQRLLEQVSRHETAEEVVAARRVLHQLSPVVTWRTCDFCRAANGEINTTLFFKDRAMPEKARHRSCPAT